MNAHTGEAFRSEREVGHVLFMDIVGYSKLFNDKQPEVLQRFKDIVRASAEVARAQSANSLVSPWSGDGMALVFFGDQEAAARAALEISRSLLSYPHIKLRMGVHSGPVERIKDFNNIENAAGKGINMAQRVMDCGNAGHILVSRRVADDLASYMQWQPLLHDLGEVKVKHGERVHLFNLYTDELGNPELPEKIKRSRKIALLLRATITILLVIALGLALFWWLPWSRKGKDQTNTSSPVSSEVLIYSLTVQKMIKDPKTNGYKPLGDPFESTGQEIYGNGWEFYVNVTPTRDGSLYLLNEGAGTNGVSVYNVLFPTKENNNHIAQLSAGHTIRTKNYFFDEYKGEERLWIIWSAKPLEQLDKIFESADKNQLVIIEPGQINTVRDLLASYDSFKPEVVTNKTQKQTTIKGIGDMFISLLELQHEQY